jgi:hypothetical protein
VKRSEIAAARLKVTLAGRKNETVSDAIFALAAKPMVEAEVPTPSAAAAPETGLVLQAGAEVVVLQAKIGGYPVRRSKATTLRKLQASMNRTVRPAGTRRFVAFGPNGRVVVTRRARFGRRRDAARWLGSRSRSRTSGDGT